MRSLTAVNAEVIECRKCPRLVAWREKVAAEKRASFRDDDYWGRPVPSFGDPQAGVLVVGLAPTAHGANRTGRMFTGDRSGDFLFGSLHRTGFANQAECISADDGLTLSGALISSPVRCAPPANKPTPSERENCRPFIAEELEIVPWKVCVVLGGIAYQAASSLLGLKPRPKFGHGVEATLPDGRVILCCFHPSQQNTFTGRLTEDMIDDVFTRAAELSA